MTQDKNPLARSVIRFEITRLKDRVSYLNGYIKELQNQIKDNQTEVIKLEKTIHTLTQSLSDLP